MDEIKRRMEELWVCAGPKNRIYRKRQSLFSQILCETELADLSGRKSRHQGVSERQINPVYILASISSLCVFVFTGSCSPSQHALGAAARLSIKYQISSTEEQTNPGCSRNNGAVISTSCRFDSSGIALILFLNRINSVLMNPPVTHFIQNYGKNFNPFNRLLIVFSPFNYRLLAELRHAIHFYFWNKLCCSEMPPICMQVVLYMVLSIYR